MPLSDLEVKKAKPRPKDNPKDRWLTDEKGLRLLVAKTGAKYWRLKYRFQGKQKTLALGVYPSVSLKQAREMTDQARELLKQGSDPSEFKRESKQATTAAIQNKFSTIAGQWHHHQMGVWKEETAKKIWERLRANCTPFWDAPITDLKPQQVIRAISVIEEKGALDVARRVLQDIGRICRFAVQRGIIDYNPAAELSGIVKTSKVEHRASLSAAQLPDFLKVLPSYDFIGRRLTRLAIELLILTFVRPGELRAASWAEFDEDNALWKIPGERMKMGIDHIVPLSKQSLHTVTLIKQISGSSELLFPSEKDRFNPMSDNTMRRAIFKLGYDGNSPNLAKVTPHGFRATASSILNETGFNPDAIERQLAHVERNKVRSAYIHHAKFLEERKNIMQWWADYLDKIRN